MARRLVYLLENQRLDYYSRPSRCQMKEHNPETLSPHGIFFGSLLEIFSLSTRCYKQREGFLWLLSFKLVFFQVLTYSNLEKHWIKTNKRWWLVVGQLWLMQIQASLGFWKLSKVNRSAHSSVWRKTNYSFKNEATTVLLYLMGAPAQKQTQWTAQWCWLSIHTHFLPSLLPEDSASFSLSYPSYKPWHLSFQKFHSSF